MGNKNRVNKSENMDNEIFNFLLLLFENLYRYIVFFLNTQEFETLSLSPLSLFLPLCTIYMCTYLSSLWDIILFEGKNHVSLKIYILTLLEVLMKMWVWKI